MDTGSLTDGLRETLAVFDEAGEPRTTPEVAASLDLGRRSTYARLERLVDDDRLETKKVGANARVWWRPSRTTSTESPDWSAAAESLVDDVLSEIEVGIFVLDENFDVAWINDATKRYFGLDQEQVVGYDKRLLIEETITRTVEKPAEFSQTVLATYDDNTYTEHFECHVTADDDRKERWLEHWSKPIETGEYAGGRVELYYDVTDRKRSTRARREDREQLESLVDAVEEYAIYTLDTQGRVRSWNSGAELIKGYEADEILGAHHSIFFTDADRAAGVPEKNLAVATNANSCQNDGWRVRKDGSRFWASVSITPMRGPDGTVHGFAKVTRDMTEHRAYERNLRRERDVTAQLLETAPVGLAVFRADGSIERINSRGRSQLNIDESAVEECTIETMDLCDVDGEPLPVAAHPARQVFDSGESVTDAIVRCDSQDDSRRWISLTATPVFDSSGTVERVVLAAKDVTGLKRTERQLERQRDELQSELEEVVERISDGFMAIDEEWVLTYLNDTAADLIGDSKDELIGENIWDAFPNMAGTEFEAAYREAMETQEPRTVETYYGPLDGWYRDAVYPSESGLSVHFQDVTERMEHQRALEESEQRYRTLVENFPNGGVALLDEDLRHTIVGGQGFDNLDFDASDLQDELVRDVYEGDIREKIESNYRAALAGDDTTFEVDVQDRTFDFRAVPLTWENDEVFGIMAMSQDVTDRSRYESQLQALYESAREFLTATSAPEITETLVESADDIIDIPGIVVYEYDAERERLVPGRTSHEAGFMRDEFPEVACNDSSITGHVFTEGEPMYFENVLDAPTLQVSPDETEMRAGLFVPLGTDRLLIAASREVDGFDANTRQLLELLATNAEAALERIGSERELIHRNEQLVALNSLNEVVSEITDAVIDQSTRDGIESTVCEHLADSESYHLAWIGDIDTASQTVNERTLAGIEDYLDGVTISVDPDDERSKGPTGRALRTGEIQTVQDIAADSRQDPWRDHMERYGVRSAAAIPIVHEDSAYGVLNVYAERSNAFEGREREMLSHLGEIVGHAIAATERKQALMSDELVELEFQSRDMFGVLDDTWELPGTITFDRTISIGDGEFLIYGAATPDAVDSLPDLVDRFPYWHDVTLHSDGNPRRFELRVTNPPVFSAVASVGGYVEDVYIEDGDVSFTIHLAPSVDVRNVIDTVMDEYPEVEMVRRRQITRSDEETYHLQRHLVSSLTDRQRAALDTAFHSGFFEWPRVRSGKEVAESMGVSPPTFHQHLRKAQRKVFEAVYSTSN